MASGRTFFEIVTFCRAAKATLGSLASVIDAEPGDWQLIPGVGPQRAASLTRMVHDEWHPDHTTSHSDFSRNGKDPST